LNKETYVEQQFANKRTVNILQPISSSTHFFICCIDLDASEVANLQAGLRLCLSLGFWGSGNAYLLIEGSFRCALFLLLFVYALHLWKKDILLVLFCFWFPFFPFLFKSAQ
jgi:hypothetical protein